MKDASLNLTPSLQEDILEYGPVDYDSKGWTVYTQEGDTRTELEADGFGRSFGIELGQTFYYSRILSEELDSPTLQLGAVENTYSVWLDEQLLYTDHPELDNRVGYLTLPMMGWFREEPIIISLPPDYQGKTLTIAQSFPDYSETDRVYAWPTSVKLYCGYAYAFLRSNLPRHGCRRLERFRLIVADCHLHAVFYHPDDLLRKSIPIHYTPF